ncbi:MAG: hypothetical protein AAB343_01515 [Patescibacteria group bacterium]
MKPTRELFYITVALVCGAVVAAAFSVSAFIYPDDEPPGYDNTVKIYAPLNTGPVLQSKNGPLGLCAGFGGLCLDVFGDLTVEGSIGFYNGAATPDVYIDESNGALSITTNAKGGVIVPKMEEYQRDAISAVQGTILFNTTSNKFNLCELSAGCNNAADWRELQSL